MYVLTSNGTTPKLYIDGTLALSWSKTANWSAISTLYRFGRNGANGTAADFYGGTYDDVSVFNTEISSTDVANLWAAA